MLEKIRSISKEKRIFSFCITWIIFAFALFAVYYDSEVNRINATMLAFSYKYGFISRGLIGTIYQFLNSITPFDMMNYDWVMNYTQGITVIYFFILFMFFVSCLMKGHKIISDEIKYMILFFTIFAIPMFVTEFNFGRLDVYCVMLSLLGATVLIWEKAEWLVVVFSALGVMVHQGNVFMFLNIILVLLLYKSLTNIGNKRVKYFVLFALSFLVASALFLYFEFFSHVNGENIYEEVVGMASSLRFDGTYHRDVIDHEILGVDVSERERAYHLNNFVQFPFFIVLMMPYIVMGVKLFKGMINSAVTTVDKWKYFFLAIGAGTIIPDLLLKCDYGRWMFAIVCYYAVVLISLLALNDKIAQTEVKKLMLDVKTKFPAASWLLVYPIILQPFLDIGICYITGMLADKVNDLFLHWW